MYGFYAECKRRYSVKLWKQFGEVFNCMPVAALIDDKIFCAHGGLSPGMDFKQIKALQRPCEVPDDGLMCYLLWSDPAEGQNGWGESPRQVAGTFGADVVRKTCEKLDIDLVVRAHEVVEEGYSFFADRQLVTLFSAPNYCGEFDNSGAVMVVDADLTCSFKVLKPAVRSRPHFLNF
eukprot:TRINITY_DN35084_c0_g1_i1.p3 TRINITY_DN35084_c0_g1~~TRINITY_DN35084_c0_g1_i1.p3  ORF type:complete len:177 (+),score=26.90 TRINITY_DN35084_c0_g1_i1:768-1298(+)